MGHLPPGRCNGASIRGAAQRIVLGRVYRWLTGWQKPFHDVLPSKSFFGHNLMRGGQGDDRLSAFNGGGILYGNEGADTIDATSATAAA